MYRHESFVPLGIDFLPSILTFIFDICSYCTVPPHSGDLIGAAETNQAGKVRVRFLTDIIGLFWGGGQVSDFRR